MRLHAMEQALPPSALVHPKVDATGLERRYAEEVAAKRLEWEEGGDPWALLRDLRERVERLEGQVSQLEYAAGVK